MAGSADLAYEMVRDGIIGGTHLGGTRLREEDLAALLGVSRTPVREALRRLHAEGLVEVTPNRGAVVARWNAEDLDEIFELRALMEGYGAGRAACRIEEGELPELDGLCDSMELASCTSVPDYDRITELNLEFHQRVHAAARSRRLVATLVGLVQVPLVHHTFHRYLPEELARSMAHHRELVAALRAANSSWAEVVMRAHVEAARNSLRRSEGTSSDGC